MSKVAILSTVHSWDDGRVFHREAKTLAVYFDVEVHAVAAFNHKKVEGISVYGLPEWRTLKDRIRNIILIFKHALNSKADIFHFHDPEIMLIVPLLKILKRKPIIYDVHEYYPGMIKDKQYIPKYFRSLISLLFELYERMVLFFIDYVFFVTEGVGQRYVKAKGQNAFLLPNLPAKYLFSQSLRPYNKRPRHILYLGGIKENRGVKILLDAFHHIHKQFPDYKLKLVGGFESAEFHQKMLSLIQAYNLKAHVEIQEKVPYSQITTILNEARIGVVTYLPLLNHQVGLPNKLIEYMGAGLAIIASDFKNYSGIINECHCGRLINPEKTMQLVEALTELIQNETLASKMAENARTCFLTKYNWETASSLLIQVYQNAVQTGV